MSILIIILLMAKGAYPFNQYLVLIYLLLCRNNQCFSNNASTAGNNQNLNYCFNNSIRTCTSKKSSNSNSVTRSVSATELANDVKSSPKTNDITTESKPKSITNINLNKDSDNTFIEVIDPIVLFNEESELNSENNIISAENLNARTDEGASLTISTSNLVDSEENIIESTNNHTIEAPITMVNNLIPPSSMICNENNTNTNIISTHTSSRKHSSTECSLHKKNRIIPSILEKRYRGTTVSIMVEGIGLITGTIVLNFPKVISLKLKNNLIVFINKDFISNFF